MTPPALDRDVPAELDGARVDRVVASLLGLPMATVKRLCRDGRVRLAGRRAAAGDRASAGQGIVVLGLAIGAPPGGRATVGVGDVRWFVPAPPLPTLYADADVVVVDKPAGMACHPLLPGEGGTAMDAAVAAFPDVAHVGPVAREGGLLHRLDHDTSGCLAVARHADAFAQLAPLLRGDHGATSGPAAMKTYLALVHGGIDAAFVVDEPVESDPGDPRRARLGGARPARTVVTPRGRGVDVSLVELALFGGRRHQLRVHLATRGHALVADALYGAPASPFAPTFLLHAWRLGLPGRVVVEAALPARFRAALVACGVRVP
ncbi:MAG: RluA family pseudouridine synthase [Deltaproteobacteria bacterium]|nr:RluA family pseudouridine synthase [Deltaproteobacteria bacterium]